MGSLPEADQITEMTGPCGDTMKVYLKLSGDTVTDVKYQVLGCPGAIAAAMAAAEMVRGKRLTETLDLKDRDVFRKLEAIPEQKQHCIRLAVKTLQKAAQDYLSRKEQKPQGE
jgi:nitrogen fixation NifU-like protein